MTNVLCKSYTHKNYLYSQLLKGTVRKDEHTKYRNTLTVLIKRHKRDYYCNFINKHKTNSEAIWGVIINLF